MGHDDSPLGGASRVDVVVAHAEAGDDLEPGENGA
jgi:hypothetical protein